MSRARLHTFALLVVLLTLLGSGAPAFAQEATPAPDGGTAFADLGLPGIAVTITDTAFEGVPAELAAGRYVLTITNALTTLGPGESAGANFLLLPEELTAEAFIAEVGPPAATPETAEAAASPMAEEEFMLPPPWYYETTLAGGPYAEAGDTRSAVVELAAGEWLLWAESPGAPQAPVPVTVTGEAPADQPAVSADLRIEMSEYTFTFPTPLTAGSYRVELANVGEQPHFLGMGRVPDGTTLDAVMAMFASFEDPLASPAADGLSFEDIDLVLDTADQSAGVTAWYTAELEPGTYLAVCFVSDPESGTPHAMLGMTQLVEVE